jgi:hypothetical protein
VVTRDNEAIQNDTNEATNSVAQPDNPNDEPSPNAHDVSEEPAGVKRKQVIQQAEGASDEEWETDPLNPRNWSARKKWTATWVVCPPLYQYWGKTEIQAGLVLHIYPTTRQLDDGCWSA